MKTSFKVIAVIIVIALFAALFAAVHYFVETANAGLHGTF